MRLSPDDEGLAAEYALGTLDAGERAAVAARRLREPELDAAISGWEARLAALHETSPERAPPPDLFGRIEAALVEAPAAVDLTEVLRARLARWRALAGGAGALAAGLAAALAFVVVNRPAVPHQFVAVLQRSADAPAFAMTVDIDTLQFSVRPVAAEAPAGKSYELWIIPPQQKPKSLGVIDAATGARRLGADPGVIRDAVYAVTVERKGGSPDGNPSGPPVFFGKLVPVGP
jgi:anti-sigma-K factor RskA